MTLNGKEFEGKSIQVQSYEIKEYRELQNMMARDKSDFDKFVLSKRHGNSLDIDSYLSS
jgi:hypothetical protein